MGYLRRILAILLFLSLILVPIPTKQASAGQEVSIFLWIGKKEIQVNGEIKEMDVAPFIKDSRTFVPIRFVSEALGAKVDWVDSEKKVSITLKDIAISLWIDKYFAYVNGVEKKLDVAPMIVDSRTFVPIRFVSENLGAAVGWDTHEQKVSITMRFYELSTPTATSTPSWVSVTPPITSTPTPQPSWALSDSDINAALEKAKKFSTINDFLTWKSKNPDFEKPLKGTSFSHVSISTPYLNLVYWAVNKNERYEKFNFSEAKAFASEAGKSLGFIVPDLYGDERYFPEYLSVALKLSDGTVIHPITDSIPEIADLSPYWPNDPAYCVSFFVIFDTSKIPVYDTVTFIIIDQGKGLKYTAEFDLKAIDAISKNP
ncbi:MAG: copper amine oxidase N-terminal domain-containing protein [Coprothermobacterota bacterium]|nr:copper amine oxidase N-terminal domain-containing protein [Coprothermobacterota bacterium]